MYFNLMHFRSNTIFTMSINTKVKFSLTEIIKLKLEPNLDTEPEKVSEREALILYIVCNEILEMRYSSFMALLRAYKSAYIYQQQKSNNYKKEEPSANTTLRKCLSSQKEVLIARS